MRRYIAPLTSLAFTVITLAADKSPVTGAPEWNEARNFYFESVDGNRKSGERAVELLSALLDRYPDDSTVMAYRGSLYLLESSWAMAPWKKGSLAKSGLALMDQAVERSPGNLEIRFIRAASTMRLPGFFKRANQSVDDFAWLAPKAQAAARSGRLDRRLAAAALLYHGLNCQKSEDERSARESWQSAVAVGPETTPGQTASRLLSGQKL